MSGRAESLPTIVYALVVAIVFAWATPFVWMLVAAFRPERFGGSGMASLIPDYVPSLANFAEAWDSGASAWTTAQRQGFANDVTRPQLIAVTDNVNQQKSDQDPAEWMPPLSSYACTYVRAWVQVKYYYDLSVDSAEKSKLSSVLSGC